MNTDHLYFMNGGKYLNLKTILWSSHFPCSFETFTRLTIHNSYLVLCLNDSSHYLLTELFMRLMFVFLTQFKRHLFSN